MESIFWMVYVEGGTAPVKMHTTQDSAEMEAQRLAIKNQCAAYVLQAIGGYKPIAIMRFDMKSENTQTEF